MTFEIGIRNSDSFLQVKITPPLCSLKPLFCSLRLQFSNDFELSFIRVLLTQENCIFNSKYWGSFLVMYTSMKLRYNWYSKPLFLVYLLFKHLDFFFHSAVLQFFTPVILVYCLKHLQIFYNYIAIAPLTNWTSMLLSLIKYSFTKTTTLYHWFDKLTL